MTDHEKAGLRGPVKTCVEEVAPPTGAISIASEYALDGRLLTRRHTNPDGSEWLTTNLYDSGGRLTKTISGKVGEPTSESLYTYDERGRLSETTDGDGKRTRTSYHYDQQGRKTSVKTFAPEVLERYRKGIATDSLWHGAEMGIGVPTGGNVTTVYDDRDLPIEMRILDKEGRTLTGFVRTYDDNGRMLEEQEVLENPALEMAERASAEQRVEFDEERLEAMNKAMKLMMAGKNGTGKWHKYDPLGRLIEIRDRNFAVERVTTTHYNEHGDKSEERITTTDNLVIPAGVPFSIDENGVLTPNGPFPEGSSLPELVLEPNITEYRYEYDESGNWTLETAVHCVGAHESSTVRRRTLTYY